MWTFDLSHDVDYTPPKKCVYSAPKTDSTSKVNPFLGSEDILNGPHTFKGLSGGSDLVLRLRLEMGLS